MPRPEFTLSGNVPEVHGLHAGRRQWIEAPYEEQWVVCRVVRVARTHHTPVNGDAGHTMVLAATSMDVVSIPDDTNAVAAIVARARAERPGQATLEDGMPPDPVSVPDDASSLAGGEEAGG